MLMRSVGIRTLKNKLSQYVRLAESGEIVLITDRDRVVAELSPPTNGRAEVLSDALLAEAMRNGLVSSPTFRSAEPPRRRPVATFETISKELSRDRER